jgi:hypothetical protein
MTSGYQRQRRVMLRAWCAVALSATVADMLGAQGWDAGRSAQDPGA